VAKGTDTRCSNLRPLLCHRGHELVELGSENPDRGIATGCPEPFGFHDAAQVGDGVLEPVNSLLCVHSSTVAR